MKSKKGKAKPRIDWWKVEGRAYQKRNGTLVIELKHPQREYDKRRERSDR